MLTWMLQIRAHRKGRSEQFPDMAASPSLWHLLTKNSDFRDMMAKPPHTQYTMATTRTVHREVNGQQSVVAAVSV